jgi:hypothetical protein
VDHPALRHAAPVDRIGGQHITFDHCHGSIERRRPRDVAKFEEAALACGHCQLLLRLRAGFALALGLGVHASTQALTMLVV